MPPILISKRVSSSIYSKKQKNSFTAYVKHNDNYMRMISNYSARLYFINYMVKPDPDGLTNQHLTYYPSPACFNSNYLTAA